MYLYEHSGDGVTVNAAARLAQSVERKALNLVVVGLSPTVGVFYLVIGKHTHIFLLPSIHVFNNYEHCDDSKCNSYIY